MAHVYRDAADLSFDGFAQTRISRRISIPVHGHRWCNRAELVEDVVAANVTSMENELDALERAEHVRSEQSMSVGDEPDHVRVPAHARAASPRARAILPSTPSLTDV